MSGDEHKRDWRAYNEVVRWVDLDFVANWKHKKLLKIEAQIEGKVNQNW